MRTLTYGSKQESINEAYNQVLNEDLKDSKGSILPSWLLQMVKGYIIARHAGNMKDAKALKADIDKEIKNLKLGKNVYQYFGDPDDPKNKKLLDKGEFFSTKRMEKMGL